MAKKRPKRQPKKLNIDVIQTQALVLVDENGTERASLSTYGGLTSLQFFDDDRSPRLTLQLDDTGANMTFLGANRAFGIRLSAHETANLIELYDAQGVPCIQIAMPTVSEPPSPHREPNADGDGACPPGPVLNVIDWHAGRGQSLFHGTTWEARRGETGTSIRRAP